MTKPVNSTVLLTAEDVARALEISRPLPPLSDRPTQREVADFTQQRGKWLHVVRVFARMLEVESRSFNRSAFLKACGADAAEVE